MIECVACLPRGMLSVACLPRGMLSVACHVTVLSHCRDTSVGRYCASSVALLSNGLGRRDCSTTAPVLCTVSRTSPAQLWWHAAFVALRPQRAATDEVTGATHSTVACFTAQRTLLSTAQLVRYPVRKPLWQGVITRCVGPALCDRLVGQVHRLAVHIRPRRRLVRLGAALGCMLLVALANIQALAASEAEHRKWHGGALRLIRTPPTAQRRSRVHLKEAWCMVHVACCTLHALHVARCTRCGTRLAATLSGLLLSSSAPTVGNSTYSILWPRGSEQHGSVASVPHTHEALTADEDAQRIEGQAAASRRRTVRSSKAHSAE
jgi:hypothetical protein